MNVLFTDRMIIHRINLGYSDFCRSLRKGECMIDMIGVCRTGDLKMYAVPVILSSLKIKTPCHWFAYDQNRKWIRDKRN